MSRARAAVTSNTSKRLHVTDCLAHIARDHIQRISVGFGLGFSDTGLNRVSTQMTNTETMKTLRFGIEIEVVGLSKDQIARAVADATGGRLQGGSYYGDHQIVDTQERIWKVVHDGSLSGAQNGEIVSPVLTYEDIDLLQSIVRAVRAAGGRSDASCGIHIHVDGASLDAKAIKNLTKMVAKQERYIEQALGIADNRLRRYCRPVNDEVLDAFDSAHELSTLRRAWYRTLGGSATRYDNSRYHGVNLNSLFFRGTVEFRWFAFSSSKLHAGEVKAYVQFVLALVAAAKNKRGASRSRREYSAESAKYDFRVFLLGLGLIGDEFKTARHHLLHRLPGSAAWKRGRPTPAPVPATAAGQTHDGTDDSGDGSPSPVPHAA